MTSDLYIGSRLTTEKRNQKIMYFSPIITIVGFSNKIDNVLDSVHRTTLVTEHVSQPVVVAVGINFRDVSDV